jgi:uncharacterized protein YcnI
MQRFTPVKVAAALGAATMLAVAAPLAASAHVTVDPSTTAASSYSVLTFSVSHGCEGSPTTALTFTVPDAIESVSPTVNPGWGISEAGNTVVYTAAEPLIDGQRTTFELSVKLPELPAGESLVFPVLQECEVGTTDWAEPTVEGEEEPAHPAPFIVLTESTGDAHGHAATEDEPAEAAVATSNSDDVVARVLGIAGLVLGTVGAMVGVGSRRKKESK